MNIRNNMENYEPEFFLPQWIYDDYFTPPELWAEAKKMRNNEEKSCN